MKCVTTVTLSCRLQDEYNKLEEEIKRTFEESKIVQEKYKTMSEDREMSDSLQLLLCLVGYRMNRTMLRRRLRELLRRVRLSRRNIRLCMKIVSEFRESVTLSCRLQDE